MNEEKNILIKELDVLWNKVNLKMSILIRNIVNLELAIERECKK